MDLAPVTRGEPLSGCAQAGIGTRPRTRSWTRFVACGGLAALFAGLTAAVAAGSLSGLDRAVMHWMAQLRTGWLETVAGVVVTLATPQLLILVTIAVAAWQLGARRARGFAAPVGMRLGLLVASVVVLKNLIGRDGPALHASFGYTPLDALSHLARVGPGGAFPSGHTTSTIVCVAALLALAGARSRVRRVALLASAAAVSLALLYMGFHWLTDVVGAWLLGAAILAVPVPRVPARGGDFG